MGKRKLFKNIAYGLASSFISRNNDVIGYWGIGKLYSSMIASGKLEIEINLIEQTISPSNNEFSDMIKYFSEQLFNQMEKEKLKRSFLGEAKIVLIGDLNNPSLSLGKIFPGKMNCKVTIIDYLNKDYTLEKDIWCREHNPKLEMKRV